MAVISRHLAMIELARKGSFVRENTRAGCVEIWIDERIVGRIVGHLRWTTFRAMIEAGTLAEVPDVPGQSAAFRYYVLSKEA